MKRVELHVHSRYSDGTLAPAELAARARKAKVELMFLTDHDSVSGYPELLEAAGAQAGLAVWCGIEINTARIDQVHVLGYGFDWRAPAFLAKLEEFRERRTLRARTMVANLNKHGIDITYEDVASGTKETLGRPHVADALRRKGIVRSRQEAFSRFLVRGKPGYADPMGPTPEEAIALIKGAGGFSSLAHPDTVQDLEKDLEAWKAAGLEGLETYYSSHGPSQVLEFRRLAERFGLLETGGSDFHGPGTGRDYALGVELPDEAYERFMRRFSECSSSRTAA